MDHFFFHHLLFREKIMLWRKVSIVGSMLFVLGITGVAGADTIAQWDFDTLTNPTGSTSFTPDASGNNHGITFTEGAYVNPPGTAKGTQLSSDTPYSPAVTGDSSLGLYNISNTSISASNIANPGTINLATNNAFTLQGWMKPSIASNNTYYLSLNNGVTSGTGAISLLLNTQATGSKWTFNLSYGGTGHLVADSSVITVGAWNFVAVTFDGSNLKMYVQDGSHTSLTNVQTLSGLTVTLPTWVSANLGTSNVAGNVLYDDFRISDTALTQSEIADSMASFTVPEPSSLALLSVGGLMLIRRRRRSTNRSIHFASIVKD